MTQQNSSVLLELCKYSNGAKEAWPVLSGGPDMASYRRPPQDCVLKDMRCFPDEPKMQKCEKAETIQETAGGLMRPKEGVVWDGGHGVETIMKGPFAMRKNSGCFLEIAMSH